MRNLFLSLVLANLLLLAWQFWVAPSSPEPPTSDGSGLTLFRDGQAPVVKSAPGQANPDAAALPTGTCFRLGPLPDYLASQQAARSLADQGIDATPMARDVQLWLGHWVQISGFGAVSAAEAARERLVAGGISDALLMQDGSRPMISLGVFRDRNGADRVASAARKLGFEVSLRNRYRPGVEHWLLVRPRAGQTFLPAELSLAGDRIMRAEPAPCGNAGGAAAAAGAGLEGQAAGESVPTVPE